MNTIQKWILKETTEKITNIESRVSMNTIQKWILKDQCTRRTSSVFWSFNEYDPEVDTESGWRWQARSWATLFQ